MRVGNESGLQLYINVDLFFETHIVLASGIDSRRSRID